MTEAELLAIIEQAEREGWTELDLEGEEIEVLPPGIGRLTGLRRLRVGVKKDRASGWFLSDDFNVLKELPAELGQLVNLIELDLAGNHLTAVPPEITQLVNLTSLNLGGNHLMAMPSEITQLVNLTSLDLFDNQLMSVPSEITQLVNLASLNLGGNRLTAMPFEIAQLVNLTSLNLGGNYLTAVLSEITQLVNLTSLDLFDNQLTSVPLEIGQLVNLTSLNLESNHFTVLPLEIGQLVNLIELRLSNNQLTTVPLEIGQLVNLILLDLRVNKLMSVPPELFFLPRLKNLYLAGNPLTIPPPELLGEGLLNNWRTPVSLAAVRRYYEELRQTGETYFYEAKLLIIGEGGAGKTSLARKLQQPDKPLPAEAESTEGIDILTWPFPLPDQPETDYQTHIWDFGGQEIYHATHQFFLTRRSVYVLLADTRQQHTNFYDWLLMQETFGGDSPVILLKNKNRHKGNLFTIENLPELRKRFPNLKEVLELDLNDVPHALGWATLLQELKHRLLQLDHIGQPRPGSWTAVREALAADERDIISESEYLALCAEQGLEGAYARDLSDYLHNVGDILHFQDDPVLGELVILKPTWGLDAVYRVLDNREIVARQGRFSRRDLKQLWQEAKYRGHHEQLLQLMRQFQLCYPLPNQAHEYIAPQLLDITVPLYEWDYTHNLQLRYRYPVFMPKGILSRAIMQLHKLIEDQRLVWRAGVILTDGHARAELLELRGAREIRIRLAGERQRDLLTHIVRTLDELHRGFTKLKYEKLVPCNCAVCHEAEEPHFFPLETLHYRLQHNKRTIECGFAPFHDVKIQPLLDDLFVSVGAGARQVDGRTQLLEELDRQYNEGELRTLCFKFGVKYENLAGETMEAKARELILYMERKGRYRELVAGVASV